MTIGVIIVLGILTFFFGSKPLVTILVAGLIGWLLCDIDVEKEYTWYSGIWHGMNFIGNFTRSIFTDAIYKADYYTTAYNIWYWIWSIASVFWGLIPSLVSSNKQSYY